MTSALFTIPLLIFMGWGLAPVCLDAFALQPPLVGMPAFMRYGDGGGVNQVGRARREQIRRRAAAMFAKGMPAPQVAGVLEVSTKAAYAWRRAWAAGGVRALASKGPPGPQPTLSQEQVDRLERGLEQGPVAAGYRDQRWTLARVAALITTMFGYRLSLQTVAVLLHRMGWSPQQPVHRAVERDEAAITGWRRRRWPAVKGSRAGWARGSASPTSPV
jgi:transposase